MDDGPLASSTPIGRLGDIFTVKDAAGLWQRQGASDLAFIRLDRHLQGYQQAAAAGTLVLNNLSPYQILITGTVAGQIIQLPNATTLQLFHDFKIWNRSSQPITINNASGGLIRTIPPGFKVEIVVADISSAAGVWYSNATSYLFPGYANSTTTFTTTATEASPVLVTGMALTPTARGLYEVIFNTNWSNSTTNTNQTFSFFVGGVQVASSVRQLGQPDGFGATIQRLCLNIVDQITLDGTQTLEVRAGRSGGTLSVFQRTLQLKKVG